MGKRQNRQGVDGYSHSLADTCRYIAKHAGAGAEVAQVAASANANAPIAGASEPIAGASNNRIQT
jgi:hypothetical protein